MKPSYTYTSETTRDCAQYNVGDEGENRFWSEEKCPECGAWVDESEIEQRSEYRSCGSYKCRQAVSYKIMIEETEYREPITD